MRKRKLLPTKLLETQLLKLNLTPMPRIRTKCPFCNLGTSLMRRLLRRCKYKILIIVSRMKTLTTPRRDHRRMERLIEGMGGC